MKHSPKHTTTLARQLQQMANDRWARDAVRVLLRASWFALSIWSVGVGLSLLLSWPIDHALIGALALAVIVIALISLLLMPRLSVESVARRLDRRFDLHEELSTALEVGQQRPEVGSLPAQLMAHAGQHLRQTQRSISQRQRAPISDLFFLAGMLVIAIALFLITAMPGLPNASQIAALPPLANPDAAADDQAFQPPPNNPGQQPGGLPGNGAAQQQADMNAGTQSAGNTGSDSSQNGAQQAAAADPQSLAAIADALRDQGATRPSAEALDRGDAASAAQQIRELADQADQLSQQTRQNLADNLRKAASAIQERNPDLAQQLRQSARNIDQGGQQAAKGLEDLAQAIEQAQQGDAQAGQGADQADAQGTQPGSPADQGQPGNQPGAGGGAGNAAASNQRDLENPQRLGVEGQPVELDAQGDGSQGSAPAEQATVAGNGSVGSTSGGNQQGGGASGPDPLRVPADERDVVQDYFTP